MSDLIGRWQQSTEESDGDVIVLRREGSYDFPPSRFRPAYELREGGQLRWLKPSPTDDHHWADGRWRGIGGDDSRRIEWTTDDAARRYRVTNLRSNDDSVVIAMTLPPVDD